MDKLKTSQQNAIKKLSDLKITAKLLEAGVDEQVVTQMDRNALMNAWAEIVTTSKEKGTGGTATPGTLLTGYNAKIEKQRLEIERENSELKNLHLKRRNMRTGNVRKRRNVRRESVRKRRKDVW